MAKVKVQPIVKKSVKKTISKPKTNKKTIKPAKKTSLSPEQMEDAIRLKAYELYILRQGQEGSPLSDWLNAQQIILQDS